MSDDSIRAIIDRLSDFERNVDALGMSFSFETDEESAAERRAAAGEEGAAERRETLEERALFGVERATRFALSLAKVFKGSPGSIYVSDASGVTRMVNGSFERATGVKPIDVLGKNVRELEGEKFFKPSVHRLATDERRRVTVLQTAKNGKKLLVTGAPIYDGEGKLEMCVSNAVTMEEIESVYAYYHGKNEKPETGIAPQSVELLTESPAMKRIMDVVDRIKDTDSTILISGESGVGKSMLAKHIHAGSNRANGPMVEINCGTIPEHLLESELFGYNSGAFTGASSAGKEGLVELAEGGTLLLDEISELPGPLQVKLLNLIQDKRIMRIGAKKPTRVDVRIIAASNNDLGELVRLGRFRADLYYRLNVIPIHMPPLRERKEDIAPAIAHFVDKFKDKYKKQASYSEVFVEELKNMTWSGNIRELENTIERMVLMSVDGVLSPARAGGAEFAETNANETEVSALRGAIARLEEKMVRAAYEKHGSSYKVAEALGISQTSAHRKIRKYCGDCAV
ncbi:MAG: sigma 54-interacting transcriptional regulator [Clostridiales Family XIII bacterium]|nr:sigma 54-interacting transcriptional regulator [Clostridiales Family XIII bacterium]